ncbi:MAG: divalent cation tolerance protein CutA [Maribacter sp.]
MILAHISVRDKKHAKKIAKLLMEKNLIFTASISTKKIFEKNKSTGKVEYINETVITGKTKALLFTTINDLVRSEYPNQMPMVYAVPIIYMDEKQTELLRKQTAKV